MRKLMFRGKQERGEPSASVHDTMPSPPHVTVNNPLALQVYIYNKPPFPETKCEKTPPLQPNNYTNIQTAYYCMCNNVYN